jgi:lipopolysaccharide/colanic/teichoic acid biosynthesis glycosyltransferase
MLTRISALFLFICIIPFLCILFILIKITSKGPFIFKQLRSGKDKKPFWIYKIRTMKQNAESLKKKILRLNEAEWPVFKIRDDPRYTKIGKILSRSGFDEIPQLINVITGEMTFVGPRPLPVDEAIRVPEKYKQRFSVLPGITSNWVVAGSHNLSFRRWMEMDIEYIHNKSFLYDLIISFKTLNLLIKNILTIKKPLF